MSTPTLDSARLDTLVNTYLQNEPRASADALQELSQGVAKGNVQAIRDLVEFLGPRLTSTETTQRYQGTHFNPLYLSNRFKVVFRVHHAL